MLALKGFSPVEVRRVTGLKTLLHLNLFYLFECNFDKTRILFQASTSGSDEMTKALLDECLDLRVKENDGNTALMGAA